MFENSSLPSRLLFVFAAVMSFVMCSDAARASPITTQVDYGVEYTVLRRSHTPYSQYHGLFPGLPSAETGIQTGTNSETELNGSYGQVSSIIDRQSNPPRVTKSSFIYSQNIPDNRQSGVGITGVQSEVRPASHSQAGGQRFEREQSRVNDLPLTQRVAPSRNSVIIRKSSHKEAASPFHQTYHLSRVRDPEDAQRSLKEKTYRKDSPKVVGHKSVWQPSDSSPFSFQTGRYWNASLPISRGHYSGYKDTNELAVVGPWSTSSGIQSTKFLGLANQIAPHSPSINSLDAAVNKQYPSPEKLPSSITDLLQGQQSVRSSETPRHKKVKWYLFKDSQTSFGGQETVHTVTADGNRAFSKTPHEQKSSESQVYVRFSSDFKQLQKSQREESTKEVHHPVGFSQANVNKANPMYRNANVAQYGAQTESFIQYQHSTTPEMSVHPAPGTYNPMESFIPLPHVDLQGKNAIGSKESVESSLVHTTTGGSVHAHKPGQTTKSIYGFRGFKNPVWRAVKEPSNDRMNFPRYSFDKGKFKIATIYLPLSPKFSFGQSEASTTSAKLERTPTDYSSSSPGILDDVKSVNPPRPFTSGFKEARPLTPKRDAGVESNPDHRQFRIYRRINGLKGLSPQPLEGAKPLDNEPDKSDRVQQGFEGFKFRSSQIWQPESSRIHKQYNKTDPGSGHESTSSQNEQRSQDLKTHLLKTEGSNKTVSTSTPDKYKKGRKIFTHLGFHKRIGNATNKTQWKYNEYSATASPSQRISSTYLRSAEDLKVESSPESEPRPPNKTEPTVVKVRLHSSSTVRGKRVRGKHTDDKKLNESVSLTNNTGGLASVRLSKRPVTSADIVGSAWFSGVRDSTQTPIAPAKEHSPNATATSEQKEGAGHEDPVHSRSPEARGEDFSSAQENNLGVGSEEVDTDISTSELLLDNEGSGSGSFNMSDVFSTDATNQRLSEDLLELEYLRIATGNISFKSMKLS